jgi:hypothetical protein
VLDQDRGRRGRVAIIGVTIGLVTVFLDGVAAKQLADQWAAAPEAEKVVALSAVSTNETINFALAGLFNLSFAGVPFLLLGLAVAIGAAYPRWLGGSPRSPAPDRFPPVWFRPSPGSRRSPWC